MALFNFVDYIGPAVSAAWLNAVDKLKFTIFNDAISKSGARAALTQDAPFEIANGGTGVRTLPDLAASLDPYITGGGSSIWDISNFGAVGDGVTDDTAAFLAFQVEALNAPGVAILNMEPTATYVCTSYAWTQGIKNLIVNGNGCTITNLSTGIIVFLAPWSASPIPWGTGNRFLIESSAVGATEITCVTAAEALEFEAGEMVMLASHDMQWGGLPPCMRYYDFVEVTSVDGDTGVITFDRPLQFAYQSDLPYLAASEWTDGRANIYKIERYHKFNIRHVYNDITWTAPNKVLGVPGDAPPLYASGYYMEFNRCTAPSFCSVAGHTHKFDGCTDLIYAEFDKLVVNMIWENGVIFPEFDSCAGMQNVTLRNSTLHSGYLVSPVGSLEVLNCNVPSIQEGFRWAQRVNIIGGTHYNVAFGANTQLQQPNFQQIQLGTTGVAWTEATSTLTITNWDYTMDRARILASSFVGQRVDILGDATGRITGQYGIIKSITGSDAVANLVIHFTKAPLTGNEYLGISDEPPMFNYQNIRNFSGPGLSGEGGVAHDKISYKDILVPHNVIGDTNIVDNLLLYGRIKRIFVEVVRPYTGADASCVLYLEALYPNYHVPSWTIDCKTAGIRESTFLGNVGWTGANGESAGANLPTGAYTSNALSLLTVHVLAPPATTVESQAPIVSFTFEFEGPLSRNNDFNLR